MSALTLHQDATLQHADAVAAWRDVGFGRALRDLLHFIVDKLDAWTDPRDDIEQYLAGAHNHAELEERMRVAFINRGGFGF